LTKLKASDTLRHVSRKKRYKAPEGLIKQKHSAHWYIKTRINGRLIYKSTRTSDLQKAELILAKVKVALLSLDSQVKQIIGKSIPFEELMGRYIKEVSSTKRSFESDKFRSRLLIKFFENRKIDTITTQDVYQYQDWRKNQTIPKSNKSISGPTINREISLLRHAFRKAIRWGYLDRNPAQGIEGFLETKRERYITDNEFDGIKKVAEAHDNSRHLPHIMDALYNTAQRSGRILNLKWPQIDLKERNITFEQLSKTKKVPFIIWINDLLYDLLTRLKSERSLKKVVGPYVFQKMDGTPYKSVNKVWNSCCRKANVKDARIHDIRHKAITDMVRAGFSLEFVGRVAGHTTPATTQRYTHLSVDVTKEALESLGRRMEK
jgi:integrase